MNKIDFLKYTSFPLDSDTLEFMQEIVRMVAGMSAICGEKVIVAGCAERGNFIEDGLVIIDGELLEFKGDTKVDRVYIEEVTEDVECMEEVFSDLYRKRCVRFGTGDGENNFLWSDFKRLDTIPALMQKITALQSGKTDVGHRHNVADVTGLPDRVVPRGLIAMWSGSPNEVPTGWTLCNKGKEYQGIFVPNLSGRFIVGYSSESDYNVIGKTGGAKMVALTPNQMPPHTHNYDAPLISGSHPGGSGGYNRPNGLNTGTTTSTGRGEAHENRPPYYVLAYIMKL